MIKILKFKYWVSVPLFAATLLYVYALLPNSVSVYFNTDGSTALEISKSLFFYLFFGLFVLTNAIIYLYQNMLLSKNEREVMSFADMTISQKNYHWLTGLSLMFNIIYITSAFYIGLYSSRDVNPNHYVALVYIGPTSLLGWFFYYFYLRFFTK